MDVYLVLLEQGASTAGALAKKLNIARSSLYGYLDILSQKGLALQSQQEGVKIWQAESPEVIKKIIDDNINELNLANIKYQNILPDLLKKQSLDYARPRFTYFEGLDGVKNILKEYVAL